MKNSIEETSFKSVREQCRMNLSNVEGMSDYRNSASVVEATKN